MSTHKEFNICIIKPENYEFSKIFMDQAIYYRYQFSKFGYSTTIQYNQLRKDVTNFVFGAWLGFEPSLKNVYPCIFINLEQLGPDASNELSEDYINLLKTSPAIDYDQKNIQYYAEPLSVPVAPILYAPYLTELNPIPFDKRPIDILFFGVLSKRRLLIIKRLISVGINVEYIKKPTFGEELSNLIRNSKCVLNLHAYDSSVFEQARASICLSRGTPVVSERNEKTNPHASYEDSVFWVENNNIEDFFVNYFKSNDFYTECKDKLFNFTKANDTPDYLRITQLASNYFDIYNEINSNNIDFNKIKVIIYAPPYDDTSGGCVALYRLATLLRERGIDASIWKWTRIHPNESRFLNGKTSTTFNLSSFDLENAKKPLPFGLREANIDEIQESIVIYPEIIEGNPLGSTKIVRWLLNSPGEITKNISYGINDFFIYWAEDYLNVNNNLNYLCKVKLPLINSFYYTNRNNPERKGNCVLIRKGHDRILNQHPTNSICIDGKSHLEISGIFNECEYLYTYDNNTAYIHFAILCGCIPIIIPSPGITFNEIKTSEIGKYGIAYGIENIEFAKETAHLAIELINKDKEEEFIIIDNLITKLLKI